MMDTTENKIEIAALLGHLTADQSQQFDTINASYIKLLSRDVADKADVEGLADAVVSFYEGLPRAYLSHENGG